MKKFVRENKLCLLCAAAGAVVLIGTAFSFLGLGRNNFNFNDFPILVYQAEAARRVHDAADVLWGYDPHFMAGYPLTFIWNSNVAVQWLAVRFQDVPAALVVRAFFLAGLFLFAPVWWWTLRNFGLNCREAAGAFLLGGFYFLVGMPALFFLVGMPTAGVATYLSLFAASFIYRYARDGGWWWIGVVILAPLSLFVHKTSVIMLFVPVLSALVWVVSRRRGWRIAGLAAAGAAAVAFNLFWLRVFFAFLPHLRNLPDAPFWQNRDPLRPLKDYFTGTVVMNNVSFSGGYGVVHTVALWLLLVVGAAGLWSWWRRGERGRALFFAATAAGLWLYSYYGAYLPGGSTLNPSRYFPVAQLWLAAAGGVAFAGGLEGTKGRSVKIAVTSLIMLGCLAGMVFAAGQLRLFNYMLEQPMNPDVRQLVESIKELPPGGRIMLEDSGVMDTQSGGQMYGKSQLPALFGIWTDREFIGGPYPYIFEDYHYASFQDGRAFGKQLADYRPGDLLRLLELYNVKWIVCWSGECKGYLRRFDGYYKFEKWLGRFEIFEVSAYKPTCFIKGSGKVDADYGKIGVSGARAEDGELVLKYHWVPTFRVEPPARIEQYKVEGDPNGFIMVRNPPERFVIRLP